MESACIFEEDVHGSAQIATLPGQYRLSRGVWTHPGTGPVGISASQSNERDIALESTLLGLDRALSRAPLPVAPPPSNDPPPQRCNEVLEAAEASFRGSLRGVECAWDTCVNAFPFHDVQSAASSGTLHLAASTRLSEQRVARTA